MFVKSIRSDRRGELTTLEFTQWCAFMGIRRPFDDTLHAITEWHRVAEEPNDHGDGACNASTCFSFPRILGGGMQHGGLHPESLSYTRLDGLYAFRSVLHEETRCFPLSRLRMSGVRPRTSSSARQARLQIGEAHLLGLLQGVRRISPLRSYYQAYYGEQGCHLR